MLKARVLTALALLGALLLALFLLPEAGWAFIVAALVGVAGWEWGGLAGFDRVARVAYGASLSAVVVVLTLIRIDASALPWVLYGLACAFWLAAVPAWLVRKWRLANPLVGALVGALVLVPPGFAMLQLRALSPLLLLAVLSAVWVADIAAYFSGRAFGRNKLAPQISPGKTWEGAAGAVVGVVGYYFLLAAAFKPAGLGEGVLWPVVALALFTAVSICGDLFESLLKRQAGVKDSGQMLPGHGGILDRIDSLTSTLPFVGLVVLSWRG
ncbi:MAG: phosphatidate cytidylyltransferase [Rhodocyclaceae bacterium]